MPIKGDLVRIDLAGIFQMLTLNQNEGTLNIYYGGKHKSIYFIPRGIIIPFDKDTMDDRVLSLLLRQGKLSDEQLERARHNTDTLNTDLLGAVLQMRYVSQEDVHAAFMYQAEEDFYELFLVKDACFEFLEDEKPSDGKTMDERFILSPENLLMEAVRRKDEWSHIRNLVPSDVEVFETIEHGLPEHVNDENGEYSLILSAIDGVRSVNRIIEKTRLHRFTVFKKCSMLADSGKIAPIDIHLLALRADESIEASRTWDAIDLYERALSAGMDDYSILEKLGSAYESVGENKKAVAQFYRLCELCEAKGALKQAIRYYTLARKLMPIEIRAKERIFQLYLNNRELFEDSDYDVISEGRELALVFKEIGRSQAATEVVHLMFEAFSDRKDVLDVLAQLALDISSPAVALTVMQQLGDLLLRDNDSSNALRVYRRIKCIDPEHRGIDDKLDRLIEDDLILRKKRGKALKTIMLIVVFIGLFSAYFLFNSMAFEAYAAINYEDLVAENEFDRARTEYESFCAGYPLSIYWFLAKEKLASIQSLHERHKTTRDLKKRYAEQERIEAQIKAENLYREASIHLNSSNLEDAFRLMKKASAYATDNAWSEENGLEDKIASLAQYFEDAGELELQAQKLNEAGKYKEAHGRLARLADEYRLAPGVCDITLPILVKSNPSGARIRINGEDAYVADGERKAVTPAVLYVPSSRALEVEVEKEGFMAERHEIDVLSNHELSFELRFRSEKVFKIGGMLASPPVQAGAMLALGYRSGRVKLYDPGTSSFLWEYLIKDLKNIESPLGVAEEMVMFCWGKEQVSALSLDNGEPLWESRLPGRLSYAPVKSGGAVFVALDPDKVALLDPETGRIRLTVDLDSAAALGPVPWKQGAVLALENGLLVWIDGRNGSICFKRMLSGRPTSIAVSGDKLLVGGAKGSIECLGMNSAELIYSFTAATEHPVNQIAAEAGYVYTVLGNKRILAVETSTLRVTGEFELPEGSICLSKGGGRKSIAAGASNSMMYLLRASDLSQIRKYRAGGSIDFYGFSLEGYAFFYSSDGVLNGIRY